MPASGWSEINHMNKLKYGLTFAVGMLVMVYTQMTYAGMCSPGEIVMGHPTGIDPVHISGVINLHVSKYGVNYPLVRGDYNFLSKYAQMSCKSAMDGARYTGSKSLTKTTDIQGNDAWILPTTSQPGGGGQPVFAIEPNAQGSTSTKTTYANGDANDMQGTISVLVVYGISLVTIANFDTSFNNTVTFSVPDPVEYVSIGAENYSVDYPVAYLDSLTVTYTETSCGIKSKQGSVINWPALYKADIVNGTAESKPYSLSFICGKESDAPLPINISFSSTNGFADAANGIVKTNLANLGLKLSWANPALPPLVLDQVNHSMLSGVGDYTVMAKPVKISNSTDTLQAGQFDTTVTMNIEFQ